MKVLRAGARRLLLGEGHSIDRFALAWLLECNVMAVRHAGAGALPTEPYILVLPWQEVDGVLQNRNDPLLAGFVLRYLATPGADYDGWMERRNELFDAGYVPLRRRFRSYKPNIIYARSDLIADARTAGARSDHAVTMTSLGRHGRFANQLWQYLFLTMYGLRNGLRVEVPAWDGEDCFGFSDLRPGTYPMRSYGGFVHDHFDLWRNEPVPRDVDFKGWFQEVPTVWRVHRQFIRRLFTLKPRWAAPLERLRRRLQAQGQTLVAIHVRRGDFTQLEERVPQFRTVPVAWYRHALTELWPRLRAPILHVGTDEPVTILPEFSDYPQLGDELARLPTDIPDHVRDFMLMRDANYLLACNSSFSTLASLLAEEDQTCLLANYQHKTFVPFDLWAEQRFWHHFADSSA